MRHLLSIWPWDDHAMAQAVSLSTYWQERPVMSFLSWIEPLRQLARTGSHPIIKTGAYH